MKPEVHDNTSGALALYRERTMTTKDGQRGRAVLLGAVFASFSQGVAFGHHSPAAFDISREITVAGTIVEYSFRNPHVYLTLEQRRPDGSTRRVEVEAGAGSVIGPLGEPALMFYPVPITLELHEDRLEMDIDWLESERTVWLDGRAHPPADQLFAHGHSVGHWEGDTLVIETTNFTANSIGLSMNVPSGTGKRVVERLRLAPDRKQLLVEARVEDPEYLTAPAEYAGEWLYRPAMQHSDEQCDLDVARRFLDD